MGTLHLVIYKRRNVACRFIGEKAIMDGRKKTRLENYDYRSDGYYFVTIVTKLRNDIFENQTERIEKELKDVAHKTTGVSLDYYVVMPNHVHVIFVLNNSLLHLGEVIRRFKAKVSHSFGSNVWQANYYEHVVRNEWALAKIREYIQNNPQELLLKFDQFYQ